MAVEASAQDAEQGETQLEEIVVEGSTIGSIQTEGSEAYSSDVTGIGSKSPTAIRDIPQSITVTTREQLDDQNFTTIEEALTWNPALTVATGDSFVGSLYARGHEIFDFSIDGSIRPLLSIYGTMPDLAFFDRVEVLSGPAGLFAGSGEPGATINLARKRAQDDPGASGSVFVGSFDRRRIEVDATGPLNDEGTVRARAVAYKERTESFIDVVEREKDGLYGTAEVDLTDKTTVSVGTILERDNTLRFSGLPTFADGTLLDVSRDTFIGSENNDADIETGEIFAEVEHALDNGGQIRFYGSYFNRDADLINVLPITSVDPATGDFSLFVFGREFEENNVTTDISVTLPFDVAEKKSEVAIGADYRRFEQDTEQQFVIPFATQNIDALDSELPLPELTFPGVGPGFNLNTEAVIEEYGLYGQAKVELLPGLTALAGARLANIDQSVEDVGRGTESDFDEKGEFLPFAGLTYDVTSSLTAYASYTEVFDPQDDLTIDADNVEPREGRQYEVGLKGKFLGGALNAQVGLYHLKDENRAVDDPDNVGFFAASGEATTKGIEAQISGRPLPGLDLIAGYAYADTDLDDEPGGEFGEIVPEHSFTAWGQYTFQEGVLKGLRLGAGVRAVSDFFSIDGDTRIEAPGYAVVDAQIGKTIGNADVSLTATNLFDKDYYERVNEVERGNFYGEPFAVTLRLTANF
ncbi:MAG: TonB-dependent siderophore receptor [Pseudomonadota bacterium]